MNATVMVIGYGNDLRSDDGIGQRIADEIASWHLSAVKSLAVHQLTPELADALANAELAIFVDAYVPSESFDVQVQSLSPAVDHPIAGHTADPQSLLALTRTLYGHCPPALWVTVPAVNFEFGDRFSEVTETGKAIALGKIMQILDKFKNFWMK
ncbi:hydrogenase maturation protease [Nostoc sp. FACHB-87]|uniref:hydrogenase maturation protease n=1 Tax=Nostocales TaxID=1161 RepID=UPI001685AC20|nr:MULTISPECIES: hydrogenase maturation protease [Nostocales]MBD2300977.1 hydrogenase maturation protease [Nostoc sp. FACHB-190]MBD2452528.1 hydrogenase maturation protease [Nostoc sp. FACHB-87]MBD2473459.1 hydrogenase maturation protease [Anabaena sp. FACHB-83]MBD2486126.1 hydrogenase maturation protease [Aulosira sp. FACHB-615]